MVSGENILNNFIVLKSKFADINKIILHKITLLLLTLAVEEGTTNQGMYAHPRIHKWERKTLFMESAEMIIVMLVP